VLAALLARDLVAHLALRLRGTLEAAAEQALLSGRRADDQLERARPVAGAI